MIAPIAISGGATSLFLGTALTLAALSFVLAPLVRSVGARKRLPGNSDTAAREAAMRQLDITGRAIQEIEFDHATGKLSDVDFRDLRSHYPDATTFAMQQRDGLAAAAAAGISDADIEEAIRRAATNRASCSECGERPEPDAVYCSNCGRYLPGTCNSCGTPINEVAASFCHECGAQLSPSL